ncbi:type I polyketide synthase [Pseudoalteromonas byunsanensis]|uniref:Carrier domain-containing protein n=1 Tax=Pseudoalteromonas byunsanensis TaxID=327939 RepID=A0A1S1N457_9GAMM|nr:type I polyketide synthase [Pseudoalteromonas byunsanensis]OHU96000.1 hypothetical protein BIW53_09365 [Pseudoalteromonas byunsanensis]
MSTANKNKQEQINSLLEASYNEIQGLRAEIKEMKRHEPVAVVGAACRFPDGCNSPEQYWEYLLQNKCSVREMTNERWNADKFYDASGEQPATIYTKHISMVEQADMFDASLFNLSEPEIELMDPQQRMLLMVCHEALEHAGVERESAQGKENKTGVFIGCSTNDYARLTLSHETDEHIDGYACLGSAPSLAAGRISYLMDFHGPAVALDTSCSSSLLAVHLACESIRRGESNTALAGGVNLILTPEVSIGLSKLQALSKTGLCKTFDADADGYVRGEGCGVVVLKSLRQAQADGDEIYAVIEGSAVNHDGASNGLTAPNGAMQEKVIEQALENANVQASDIHYVETHGTGTSLGDPIEVNSLGKALRNTDPETPLLLGSVKANIGHLEAAAGIASLIKMVMSHKTQTIAPQVHFEQPNPYISWQKYQLEIPNQMQRWDLAENKKYGAISAFGLSGTNVHMITSAYHDGNSEFETEEREKLSEQPDTLVFCAGSKDALYETAKRWIAFLNLSTDSLQEICANSRAKRVHQAARVVFYVSSIKQLITELEGFIAGRTSEQCFHNLDALQPSNDQVAFLFSGQGSQYLGMGKQLYQKNTVFTDALNTCADLFLQETGKSLLDILWHNTDSENQQDLIDNTEFTQPAIFCIEIALCVYWQSKGLRPSVVLAHSVGEYAAACITGVMSIEHALKLIIKRAQLMATLCQPGSMLSISESQQYVEQLLASFDDKTLALAAINGEKSCVVAGTHEAIDACKQILVSKGVKHTQLKVSHAFHSPMMQPMLARFRQEVEAVQLKAPQVPFISSVTGLLESDLFATADYWVEQIVQPVQFYKALQSLNQCEERNTLEIGGGSTLTGLLSMTIDVNSWQMLLSLHKKHDDTVLLQSTLTSMYLRKLLPAKALAEREPFKQINLPVSAPTLKRYWCDYDPKHYLHGAKASSAYQALNTPQVCVVEYELIAQTQQLLKSHSDEKWLLISDEHTLLTQLSAEYSECVDTLNIQFLLSEQTLSMIELDNRYDGVLILPCAHATYAQEALVYSFTILNLVNTLISKSRVNKGASFIYCQREQSTVATANVEMTLHHCVTSLFRTLRLEQTQYNFVSVVLASSEHDDYQPLMAMALSGHLKSLNENELRILDSQLYRPKLKHVELASTTPHHEFSQQDCYLISGGLGALGLVIAQHLAKSGVGRLILLSRRTQWPQETQEKLDKIRQLGACVEVLSIDVCDYGALYDALNTQSGDPVNLTGIIHCAGVLEDRLSQDIDEAAFMRVQRAKVVGAYNLHQLSLEHPVKQFVLFGSLAATFGNIGQAAYGMANGFLHDLSNFRRTNSLPSVAIAWGPWAEQGMAEDALVAKAMDSVGIELLAVADALAVFDRCLRHNDQDLIVMQLRLAQLNDAMQVMPFPSYVKQYVSRCLQEQKNTPNESLSQSNDEVESEFVARLSGLNEVERQADAMRFIREKIAYASGNKDVFDYPKDQSLVDIGFDSLMAVQLRNTLAKSTQLSLPVSLLYDYPNIDSLAQYILSQSFVESEATQMHQDVHQSQENEDIAVIGMGCRFPGGIDSPQGFWRVLSEGWDAVSEIGNARWDCEYFFDEDPDAPGKMYSKWGGLLNKVDEFDNRFFGISYQEAMMMDPQQRLLLEVSWQTLEHANILPNQIGDSGVFVGCGPNEYTHILKTQGVESTNAYFGTGNSISVTAGRLAYYLGWQGPAMAIDTACSSSLVSINLACDSLRKGDCSMALAGGVNLTLSPQTNVALSKARMLSPSGRCKTFDNSADGYVRSEGCALVLLKTLSQAQKDGDNILAVIKGGAINHDGRSQGLTAPNGPSQERVIKKALARAGCEASAIQYVEAHGTGTPLGDPIEMRTIENVYGVERDTDVFVGAVKSNIGHTEAAAGVASLQKVILMMHHGQIVKNLHVDTLNEHFSEAVKSERGPVRIARENMPWEVSSQQGDTTKRAAVSSFGFSGTNAHLILEAYTAQNPEPNLGEDVVYPSYVLPVTGKNKAALQNQIEQYQAFLAGYEPSLTELCYTASTKREHFAHRTAFVATDLADLRQQLSTTDDYPDVHTKANKLAFMFTGQGSQYVGMGQELAQYANEFKRVLTECDALMHQYLGCSILSVMWEELDSKVNDTYYTQPALFALEYALAKQWVAWGVEPNVVCGHSVGEYAAACLAGVMSLPDAVKVICARSRLMVELCQAGSMLAVFADKESVQAYINTLDAAYSQDLSVAAVNGEKNIIVSGSSASVAQLEMQLAQLNVNARSLVVSHAFHSTLMKPMLASFYEVVNSVSLNKPTIPFVSTVTGEQISNEITDPQYWVTHVEQAVLYADALDTLAQLSVDTYLEIGPANQLMGMAKRHLDNDSINFCVSLKRNNEWQAVLSSVAALFSMGKNINWTDFYANHCTLKAVMLPTYPFQRTRIWPKTAENILYPTLESSGPKSGSSNPLGSTTELANGDVAYINTASANTPFEIEDHQLYNTVVLPGASHLAMSALIAKDRNYGFGYEIRNVLFPNAMVFGEQQHKDVQYVLSTQTTAQSSLTAYSKPSDNKAKWTQHYSAELIPNPEQSAGNRSIEFDLVSWQTELGEMISGEHFYREMDAAGYQLTGGFRWIEQIWRKPGKALTRLRAPHSDAEKSYLIYPGLMDAFFQSTAAASPDATFKLSDTTDIYIPMAVDAMSICAEITSAVWCYIEMLQADEIAAQQETFSHRIWVFNDEGRVLLWFDALRSKKAPKSVLLEAIKPPLSKLAYDIQWQEQTLRNDFSTHSTTLPKSVLCLAYDYYPVLADSLTERGIEHHWLVLDESCIDIQTALVDEQAIRSKLEAIIASHKVHTVLNLLSHEITSRCDHDLSKAQTCMLQPTLLTQQTFVKHLQEPDWIFTAFASEQAPIAALFQGFARVLRNEFNGTQIKLLDFDQGNVEAASNNIVNEIVSADSIEDVRYIQNRRYTAKLMPSVLDTVAQTQQRFDETRSYIIAGGLGAIGLGLTQHLIDNGAKYVVLLSRRQTSAEVEQKISQWNRSGASVCTVQCDITNFASVEQAYQFVETTIAPVDGIFNCAGVLSDGLIDSQPWSAFVSVLDAKVAGSWNLHKVSLHKPLNWFVLFSSIATVFGSTGQANYAAANAFLDALAYQRKALGLSGLSINWGPWAGAGMAAGSSAQAKFERAQGLGFLVPEDAFELMMQLQRHNMAGNPLSANYAVVDVDWSLILGMLPSSTQEHFFSHMRTHVNISTGAGEGLDIDEFKQQLASTAAQERLEFIQHKMNEVIGKLMALDKDDVINPTEPLLNIGFDSLMALELRNSVSKLVAQKLPATLLFDYPTIATISAFILEKMYPQEHIEQESQPQVDSVECAKQREAELELEAMSDSELAKMLADELM